MVQGHSAEAEVGWAESEIKWQRREHGTAPQTCLHPTLLCSKHPQRTPVHGETLASHVQVRSTLPWVRGKPLVGPGKQNRLLCRPQELLDRPAAAAWASRRGCRQQASCREEHFPAQLTARASWALTEQRFF